MEHTSTIAVACYQGRWPIHRTRTREYLFYTNIVHIFVSLDHVIVIRDQWIASQRAGNAKKRVHVMMLLTLCAGIHRSRWITLTKANDAGALVFSLICAGINGWVNNREASDLRRHRAYYDVIVMSCHYEYVAWDWKSLLLLYFKKNNQLFNGMMLS